MAEKKLDNNYWVEPLKMFSRLSAWIVFPVLFGALLGKWLDNRYGSSPRWFLIVVGLSFVVSMVGLIKNTLEEYKNIEKRK
ncbi:MAG: AtpZ/AtpI family protein [Candidatus Falkowbacteria bacterium]